ncbi:sigma 54-interacting transcriptional regulator [Peribacillus butanolivorans]|uniref:sigma 54-interacting transcriptional regulator n=1 Tax=Peribacillus butanolivorans TaxID=421767 RepID=UPI0036DD70B8
MRHNLVEHKEHFQRDELEVARWMKTDFVFLRNTTTLKDAAELLIKNQLNEVPIVDEHQHFLGVLSLSMIMQSLLKDTSLAESIEIHYDRRIKPLSFQEILSDISPLTKASVPVVNNQNILIGVLTQHEILEVLAQTYHKMNLLETKVEWFNVCFDNIYEGIIVVDKNGFVKMINKAYSSYLGMEQGAAIGQHVVSVIEGTRLHIVLQTGIPERNQVQFLQGQEVVAHRIPIWRNNEIIGGIGILVFQGVSELYRIFDRIQDLQVTKNPSLSNINIEQQPPKLDPITFAQVIGESESFAHAKNIARRAAKSPASILITGESGVGKEIFTQAIHSLSNYSGGPFISVNCASIPEQLLESELFGYEEGAFTGSKKKGKPGKFLLAHKGTLFLDEIGDMPLHMQSKILRVLQEREVEPVGGSKPISVDFRLIAATNRPIEDMIEENKFREDLYYRLNVIPIYIPPLRERKNDIPLLIGHFIKLICKKYKIPSKEISRETVAAMMEYEWPGNIRELVNVIERLVTLVEGHDIYFDDFQRYFLEQKKQIPEFTTMEKTKLESFNSFESLKNAGLNKEKELLRLIIKEEKGNKTRAAKKLGISRATLYNKLKEYNIELST